MRREKSIIMSQSMSTMSRMFFLITWKNMKNPKENARHAMKPQPKENGRSLNSTSKFRLAFETAGHQTFNKVLLAC